MEASIITGYKLLTRNLQSLSNERRKITYSYDWQKIPGNGGYIAVTDGLTVGGMGARLFQVEGKKPLKERNTLKGWLHRLFWRYENKAIPKGVVCCRWVRLVKELKSVRIRNTRVKCYQRKGNYYGVRETFYPDGQLKERLHYRNGQFHGVWENFYPSGQLKYRDYYRNGDSYGVWESFSPDGRLKYRSHFRKGKLVKISISE